MRKILIIIAILATTITIGDIICRKVTGHSLEHKIITETNEALNIEMPSPTDGSDMTMVYVIKEGVPQVVAQAVEDSADKMMDYLIRN